jgi:hypothetical protein
MRRTGTELRPSTAAGASPLVRAALDRARDISRRADALREESRRAAVAWTWTAEGTALARPGPYARERRGHGPAPRKLPRRRPGNDLPEGYAVDREGEIVRCVHAYPGVRVDTYRRRVADGVEAVSYCEEVLGRAEFTALEAGRVTVCAGLTPLGGRDWEIFDFDAEGRLVLVRGHFEDACGAGSACDLQTRLTYAGGELASITVTPR